MLFADYGCDKWNWITAFDAKYYPDHFPEALELYTPVINRFRELLRQSTNSANLLRQIQEVTDVGRIQLLRIFRRYVSPSTSVEMLKRKGDTEEICRVFGPLFRDIRTVRSNISVSDHDLVLSVLLFEHKDRGNFGYELTERFFDWFEHRFSTPPYRAEGPRRAGADIELRTVFSDFHQSCPTDILIRHQGEAVMVGFARYDSDRGGSQEDDRTGGNQTKVTQILEFSRRKRIRLKVLFLNDGPGLLLGSMWRDYGEIESIDPQNVLVCTLKMLPARLTENWMLR